MSKGGFVFFRFFFGLNPSFPLFSLVWVFFFWRGGGERPGDGKGELATCRLALTADGKQVWLKKLVYIPSKESIYASTYL